MRTGLLIINTGATRKASSSVVRRVDDEYDAARGCDVVAYLKAETAVAGVVDEAVGRRVAFRRDRLRPGLHGRDRLDVGAGLYGWQAGSQGSGSGGCSSVCVCVCVCVCVERRV